MRLARIVLIAALPLLVSTGVAAADLSGKWLLDGDVQGNPIPMACVVTQAGEKLTGKCLINGTEETEIDGTTTGSTFKFSFTVQGYTLTYSGTLEGDSVKGDIEVAGATGTFSGKRG